ncbi:Lipase (class 2) [Marinobacter daqiaonensis]|uniref:Lipase (Class 2) n=1 Tax=Marinobacter daqiaonensis TaxID=650891 RepID=A0A1I6I343_9GAMM|nr:lipase [Marinobacter daqiaonensis]SFR61121.1 Lipase (class 2) [Marinobacter daqiaonensis]
MKFLSLIAVLLFALTAQTAFALNCGSFDGKFCSGEAFQFGGGFSPTVGYGGFGGDNNTASKVPVVFIHGNADSALGWDSPTFQVPGYSKAPHSVYDHFKAAGYNDSELFGVTWLHSSEQGSDGAPDNYHQSSKYYIIAKFIKEVKAYTGASKVDIVSHSMGVSQTLAALEYYGTHGDIRRFVNIAGGLRGLHSCYYTGYANPYAKTCGSQNAYDKYVFGFFKEGWYGGVYVNNDWTGTGTRRSMRNMPGVHSGIRFYTISAGWHDQIHCSTTTGWDYCGYGPDFNSDSNVIAQVDVGTGSYATQYDWDWADGMLTVKDGGDIDGVGHFHSRSNTGAIIHRMLSTTCSSSCADNYSGAYGPAYNY